MASVLESLTKKLEVLGEGKIYEESLFESENLIAVWTLDNPRVYKPIFNLDNKGGLGIEKTLKSFLFEVKDSLCTIYYILDSACLSLDFSCKYQLRETIREVPLSLITYLRVLCSKKAPIEISIDDNFIYIVFEDSIVKGDRQSVEPKPKLKKGEKREKEVGKKYVLELPFITLDPFHLAVLDLHQKIVESERQEIDTLISPIDLSNISYEKEPLEICKYEVDYSFEGSKCKLITTNPLLLNLSISPLEVGRDNIENEANKYAEKYIIPEDADVDYEEDMQHLNDVADMIDAFMIGEEDDIN